MKKKWLIISVLVAGVVLVACFSTPKKNTAEATITQYKQDISKLNAEVAALILLLEQSASEKKVQQQFKQARQVYKHVEWLAEYYSAYTAKRINGPALEEVEPDEKSIVIQPEGFQVVEELLFPVYDKNKKEEVVQQAKILQSNIGRLQNTATVLQTTDAHIFDALRLEVFRIIALGISGFDSPVANNSIAEAGAALQAIEKYVSIYNNEIGNNNKKLFNDLQSLFTNSQQYLSKGAGFNNFDRLTFITNFLNPLSQKLLLAQQQLGLPAFTEPRALKADAATLFAKDIFNPDFYTPDINAYNNNLKIGLGKKLFYDGFLSGNGKRSCATCHQPQKAFTDGLKTSFAVDGKNTVKRNAPTLLNAALQPALFYDTRVPYLEDQAKDVIINKDEMHGSLQKSITYIKGNKEYTQLFKNAYPDEAISELHIQNALASYIRSLTSLNARFDQYMQGDKNAMNQIEKDGFNLFMGKAKCGTCHFTPLFNGANPPLFDKIDAEVIGVPATTDTVHPVLDKDKGKYSLYKIALHQHAFKTPTLRNIALTAPYMHNGVYNTLEEVIDFYNRGGGVGLGLEVPNQTLPEVKLNLSNYEKKALVAFLHTLTNVL